MGHTISHTNLKIGQVNRSMRCDYVDDIGTGEADGDLAAAVERSSIKISKIAKRSREKADQNMAGAKCKCLLLQSAQAVGATKRADVEALGLKFQCECGEPFASVAGLSVHQRNCYAANESFETDETNPFGYFEILVQVQVPVIEILTQSLPLGYWWILTLLQDIYRIFGTKHRIFSAMTNPFGYSLFANP